MATQPCYLVSNNAGTGDYVGWCFPHTAVPVLAFQFARSTAIDSITIHMDNSNIGGVFARLAIRVDGITQGFAPPSDGSIGSVTLAGLGLTGNSHTIQLRQDAAWTFISEMSFDGGPTAVPEPTTFALLGLALAGLVATRRRS